MTLLPYGRNAPLLALAQALYSTSLMITVTLAGLVGAQLAPSPALSTLPLALMMIGNIAVAGPVSLLMQRFGRRAGFTLGGAAAALGGIVCAYAVVWGSFALFCAGTALVGVFQAASMYFRLAAADGVAPERRGGAVSMVLTGGILAALIAPTLTLWTKDWWAPIPFAGSFLALSVLGLATLVPVAVLAEHRGPAGGTGGGGRPMGVIVRQPIFIAAAANVAVGQGVMILVMHATPLAMVGCGLTVGDAAGVIQWHVLGMYVPSFLTGRIINRTGAAPVAALGAAVLAASATVSAWDQSLPFFQAGLVLLGIGWNFMYVAGTTMLTQSHTAEERGRVQGMAEMAVAATGAVASFASGGLISQIGWTAVNVGMVPLLALAVAATLWHLSQSARLKAA